MAALAVAGPARAADPPGLRIARAACGGCHATGTADASPLPAAPPFRELNRRFPPGGGLMALLSEGMIAMRAPDEEGGEIRRHPAMPQVTLDEAELHDLAAYIESIQTPTRARRPPI